MYQWINGYNMTEAEEDLRDELHGKYKYYCFIPESEAIVGDVFFFFNSLEEDVKENTLAGKYIRKHYKETESFDAYLSHEGKKFFNEMHDFFTENFHIPKKDMRKILKNFLEWNEDRDEGFGYKLEEDEKLENNFEAFEEYVLHNMDGDIEFNYNRYYEGSMSEFDFKEYLYAYFLKHNFKKKEQEMKREENILITELIDDLVEKLNNKEK